MIERYENLADREYRSMKGLGSTDVKNLTRSVAYMLTKQAQKANSDALRFGTAFHTKILQPHLFNDEIHIIESSDKRTKAYKEGKAEAEELGKLPVTREEHSQILSMEESLIAHPKFYEYLTGGKSEVSYFWEDDLTDVQCKGRIDHEHLKDEEIILVDLKTTDDGSFSGAMKTFINYKYHLQAAFYLRGLEKHFPDIPKRFIFFFVEKGGTHECSLFEVSETSLDSANEKIDEALVRYSNFLNADRPTFYRGYPKEVQTITLPSYA